MMTFNSATQFADLFFSQTLHQQFNSLGAGTTSAVLARPFKFSIFKH